MNKLEIPNLDRWRAGELPDAAMFNELQDAQDFLLDPPTVKVRKTSNASITSAQYTVVGWDEAVEDNCKQFGTGYDTAMWNPSVSWKLTCQVGGWYEASYTTAWDTTTDDKQRLMAFDLNNGPETIWQRGRRNVWHLNDYTVINATWPVFMNVGDYVQLWVFQDKGSSTNLVVTTPEPGRRSMMKLKWVSL